MLKAFWRQYPFIMQMTLSTVLCSFQVCWYCGHPGASIYCAKPGCRRVFHLTCGVQSGCLSQFLDTFDSLCHKHNNEFRYKDYKEDQCVICRDPLKFTCDALQTDCCNSVFHRRCIGSLALSAGYFFKCPLCNNTEAFRKCMRRKGIYVPDRDASWELEANAYNELHAPKYSCEAKVCLSKQGREFNSANGFAFMSCSSCGAGSIHRKCCYTPDFICEICSLLYKSATVKMEDTLDNNTLSESVLFEVLRPVTAPNEVEQDQNTPRRSARQPRAILQRQESPAVSPLKQLLSQRTGRNIRSGGTPKRRRLH